MDVQAALESAKRDASPCVRKEIDAMIRVTEGHSGKEIVVGLGASAKLICAWVSQHLKSLPEILALANI